MVLKSQRVSQVRRELSATMRDLVELVGLGHVAAFLERIVSGEGARVAALTQQQQQAGQQQGQGDLVGTSWTQLESSLYAANVALAALHEGGAQGGRCAHAHTVVHGCMDYGLLELAGGVARSSGATLALLPLACRFSPISY